MKYYNFIFTKDKKFIFSYNPKVACTNWKCIMRYYEGFKDNYLDPSIAHNRDESGLVFLSQEDNPSLYLNDDTVKRFSFVRNPYSRIVSAYANKIEPYVNNSRTETQDNPYFYKVFKLVEEFSGANILDSKSGFLSFLKWIDETDDFHSNNEHWRPQSELLDIDSVKYDFVGRLENVGEDSKYIIQELGLDIDFPKQKDVSFAPTNATDRLAYFLTPEAISLVNNIYLKDFINFGYGLKEH